jgi:hypothetical protein
MPKIPQHTHEYSHYAPKYSQYTLKYSQNTPKYSQITKNGLKQPFLHYPSKTCWYTSNFFICDS